MWLFNYLWDWIIGAVVAWIVKTVYGVFKFVWWISRAHPRTQAYVALRLYLPFQEAMLKMLQDGLIETPEGKARIRRVNGWFRKRLDVLVERAKRAPEPTPKPIG